MCGIFGFSNYAGKVKKISKLTNSLAQESAIRGTDATGVAYVDNEGKLVIKKDSKSAYSMKLEHPENVHALIGHTRHATQGSEKQNYNNHPFKGRVKHSEFALTHNGVLSNDHKLRCQFSIPKPKIETDSYIAVQLIESRHKCNLDSIRYMAEMVEGSFSFGIVDKANNIYLVKGSSPISILHFPTAGIYVYASTEEILFKALIGSTLFDLLKDHTYEEIKISDGDIVTITSSGEIKYDRFDYKPYFGRSWYDYGYSGTSYTYPSYAVDDDYEVYIKELKDIASFYGYSDSDIDHLLESGYSPEEIEDYLYGYYIGEV